MSDGENTKGKAKGGVSAWSEHEVVSISTLRPLHLQLTNQQLVYLLSAIEHNGVKIDYAVPHKPHIYFSHCTFP
jgi:hypothetical protein